ncbi:MAG: hypothetical protein FWE80_05145, partial [Oscillospiraceae bacterium]|nr:hypothetical protein [Oscillospiraceae bacterium]
VASGFKDITLDVQLPDYQLPVNLKVYIDNEEQTDMQYTTKLRNLVAANHPDRMVSIPFAERKTYYRVTILIAPITVNNMPAAPSDYQLYCEYGVYGSVDGERDSVLIMKHEPTFNATTTYTTRTTTTQTTTERTTTRQTTEHTTEHTTDPTVETTGEGTTATISAIDPEVTTTKTDG